VQLAGIALVFGLGPKAGDAPALVVGVELELEADGAPSSPMGVSIPQAKHMRDWHYAVTSEEGDELLRQMTEAGYHY
jgi:hypothetical protein